MQGSIPDRQRTAALGAVRALVSLGMATGGIAASLALEVLDPLVALAAFGALLPLAAIIGWPRWRSLDETLIVPREQVAALRGSPLFAPLTLAQLEQLASGTTVVRYPEGSAVITEDAMGDAFYLLTEGTVAVTVAGVPVATLAAGDSFGELALLKDQPRAATVTTRTGITAYRVDAATLVSAVCGSAVSREAADERMHAYVRVPAD